MNTEDEPENPGVIVWNTSALQKQRDEEIPLNENCNYESQTKLKNIENGASTSRGEESTSTGKAEAFIGSPDWRQRKLRLQKQWPVPKLQFEFESDEGFLGSSESVEGRNSLSPVLPRLYDKARSCSTSSCSTDSTDLGMQGSPMQQEEGSDLKCEKDIFFKKKLRARYLSSQSSEDSEVDIQKTDLQRQEFKLRSKSADLETAKERPVLQRQSHSLSTIEEGSHVREANRGQSTPWWVPQISLTTDKHVFENIHIKQEPFSPHLSSMMLSRGHSFESLSDAPDVFSPLTPKTFSLPLHYEGEGGVFRFPVDGSKVPQPRQFTPPRSPRSPRYIPDSRLECLSELPQSGSVPANKNTLLVPKISSPNKSPTNVKDFHSQNIFTFSPLVIPPGEGSLKTLPRTPTSGFPLGLQDNPSTYPPKYVFSPQLYNNLAEAQRHGHNNGGNKNDNTFICPICYQIFSSYDNLAKHMAKHLPTETVRSGNNNKIHYCKVCNRGFARSDMLTRHMRLHTGLKPYECQVCSQVFSRSDHLNTHQRTHTGEKPYKCPQCPYAACRRDMITRHMRIHSKQWPKRGSVKGLSASMKDDIRKSSLSSVDSTESNETGRRNMSMSSVDSFDNEKESRKGSFASSDSFESDISGRSLSGDSSMELCNTQLSHHLSHSDRLTSERSPKKVRGSAKNSNREVLDNLKNIYLQIPRSSGSTSTVDSDEIPSPRPQTWSFGGSLDEHMFLRESSSLSLSQRAYSEEGMSGTNNNCEIESDGSPTPRLCNVSDMEAVSQQVDDRAFFEHRNNRTVSLDSESQDSSLDIRDFNMKRWGLKKQRNFSSTSFDSVGSVSDEKVIKTESSLSLDESSFVKCNVSSTDSFEEQSALESQSK